MAKNDTILLDGILDDRINSKTPSDKRDEVFEYFAIEQILKDSDLSAEDIIQGKTDGRNDGGIDGFYILVNGHLLTEPDSFFWPKSSIELEVHLITCKHHETFKQSPLDNLAASLSELLDLSIDGRDLINKYNEDVISKREHLKLAYRKLSPRLTSFVIKVSYASRGVTEALGTSILARGNQIARIIEQSFGGCKAIIAFYGSNELIDISRRTRNFSLELPFLDSLAKGERYVLLTRISDYFDFVRDENQKLRRYLFDSNVRDFMGLNRVNEDIKATLENEDSPDFWWLNNGITILATSATVVGKTIHLENIQIVNGLQTTESIYKYFATGASDRHERSVLVKVIVSNEKEIRDAIIRATNNQTNVELSALHATDKIQRDIEDILFKNNLYYERRTNFYANQGVQPRNLVAPLYLAAGFVSLILKDPARAAHLRSKFMRSSHSYDKVFSDEVALELWPIIARILKKTDAILEKQRSKQNASTDGFLRRWRHILSFLTISKIFRRYNFSTGDLLDLNLSAYSDELIGECWEYIRKTTDTNRNVKISRGMILRIFQSAATELHINGYEQFESRTLKTTYENIDLPNKTKLRSEVSENTFHAGWAEKLDSTFIEQVEKLLPTQPWRPGVHIIIAKELDCADEKVAAAINHLVASGRRYKQKDGVVFDNNGKVINFDRSRVDPVTMTLISSK